MNVKRNMNLRGVESKDKQEESQAPAIFAADWNTWRIEIQQLYVEENKSLCQTMQALSRPGFRASRRQMTDQLHIWDMKKQQHKKQIAEPSQAAAIGVEADEFATPQQETGQPSEGPQKEVAQREEDAQPLDNEYNLLAWHEYGDAAYVVDNRGWADTDELCAFDPLFELAQ